MVRHHDGIGPRLRRELCVRGVEDALEDELAVPELLHPFHVFPRQRRVELPGDPLRQGGEALRIRDAAFEVAEGLSLSLEDVQRPARLDRKSTRLNSSHSQISYAVFCLKKKIQ